jgi:uncharacterized repeat protein (TIGR01451 family)
MGTRVGRPQAWRGRRWSPRVATLAGIALILSLLGPVPPVAAASITITSAGPLTSITISDELNCAVNHTGDSAGEFFGDTACATEIAVGGAIYGPSSIPAGNSPGGYTPVSQSAVTGSGTNVDPYKIVTVVDVGTTGLRITETDSYVVGQEAYRTDVQVANTGTQAASTILYRGGDCYLQNSDLGFGAIGNPAGAVACVAAADPNNPAAGPGSRIEQWIPLTTGSHYIEAFYATVWSAMSAMTDFPDTCICATYDDNGAGLSWALAIPAGQSRSVSHLTNFSPQGNLALTTSKTADQAGATVGAQDGYTITVSNPNASAVQLASITDTLPAGFSYVSGSTTGVTTSNPSVSLQTLTWTGPFTVPAASGPTPGTASLHFNVTVSSTPGTYFNNATADGGNFSVIATGDTAPITVTGGQANQPPTANAHGPYTGTEGSPTNISGTASDPDSDPLTTTWSAAAGAGTDPGAACTFGNANALSTTVTCNDDGSFTLTLSVNDGHNPAVTSTASLTVANANPGVSITSPPDASTFSIGATINLSASITDPGSNDTHTCLIDWGDGTSGPGVIAGGVCTGSHTYSAIGVYTITVTATDDDGGSGSASIMVVISSARAKVTGGGFIISSGRISFGFVVMPADGGTFKGQIQIRKNGIGKFHGDVVTSLGVAGHAATWAGTGTWNHAGGYTFQVSVVDNGQGHGSGRTPDTIALTIRNAAGAIVFSASGALKGGNIVVH